MLTRACRVMNLEAQSTFTSGIRQGGHPTMILVMPAVETDLFNPRCLGPLGNQLPDCLGRVRVAAVPGEFLLLSAGGNERHASPVVDDLGHQIAMRTVDRQAGTFRAAAN